MKTLFAVCCCVVALVFSESFVYAACQVPAFALPSGSRNIPFFSKDGVEKGRGESDGGQFLTTDGKIAASTPVLLAPQAELYCGGGEVCGCNYFCVDCYDTLPTFANGWNVWVGWAASFSDSYLPENENLAYLVYFAPDGVYLTQQCSKAYYSGVDVNIGYGYFFGLVKSPQGEALSKEYLKSLMGVSLAYQFTGMGLAPFGPLANLKVGATLGPTFFRVGDSKILERTVQFGAGFSVAYELVPLPVPGTASLDYFSNVNIGFKKILNWTINDDPNLNPMTKVQEGLQIVADATKGSGDTDFLLLNQMSERLLTFFNAMATSGPVTLPAGSQVNPADYFADFTQYGSTPANLKPNSVDNLKKQTEEWLTTGDTQHLSEALYSSIPLDRSVFYKELRGIDAGTRLAFELGYYYNTGDNYVYAENCGADKIIECKPGDSCTIEVTAVEIADLVPGKTSADFEGKQVIFDNPTEHYLSTMQTETRVTISNGKAIFSFSQSSDVPAVIGARVDPAAVTNNNTIELCRRVVQFPQSVLLLGQTPPAYAAPVTIPVLYLLLSK